MRLFFRRPPRHAMPNGAQFCYTTARLLPETDSYADLYPAGDARRAAYARKTVDIAAAGVCLALAGRVFARFVVTRPGATGIGVGSGYYGGQSAMAIGVSAMSDGGNWIVKGNFSANTGGHVGVGAGALYQW